MEMSCTSSSRGLQSELSLLSARDKAASGIGMDGPHYVQLKECPHKLKKDKLESASKTLHDTGIKAAVIFREHIAEWKAGWNIYLNMHETK